MYGCCKQQLQQSVQLTEMQLRSKDEIMKKLNLEQMIAQYLNEGIRPKRQTRHDNKKQKQLNSRNEVKGIRTSRTTDVNAELKEKRARSTANIVKKNKYEESGLISNKSLNKTNSSRINRTHETLPIPKQNMYKSQNRAKFKSTKLFKSDALIKQDQKQLILGKTFEIAKHQDQSTYINSNMNESQQQIKQNSKCLKVDFSKKQKLRLRFPAPYLEGVCKKTGTLLKGRYRLQKLIGRGLSGQVYRGWDILSQRYVAIKIIDQNNPQYQFIKQLQHPNLISYYNSFLENDKRYIVLEYLPKSLAVVTRKQKLTDEEMKRIFKAIVSGLMYLHSLSYAHRDIKLDNIVASEDLSVIKFIDFGLCLDTAQSDAKEKRRFCGTTSYMAPEVIAGKCKQPKRADIWSLGIALYTLSVGKSPFCGRQENEIFFKIQNNKTLFPSEMSQSLKNLLTGMLNKDPQKRPTIFQIINHNWLLE